MIISRRTFLEVTGLSSLAAERLVGQDWRASVDSGKFASTFPRLSTNWAAQQNILG